MSKRPTTPAELSARKIRFAVVGCGRIAAKHFEAIAEHKAHAELVAVCDTDPKALAAAVKATGSKGFVEIDELLAADLADVVVLALVM